MRRPADTGLTATALSVAAAIGVFGVVYGAVAGRVLGPTLAVTSSVLTFSGAAQFTMVGLLAADATAVGVLAGVVPLALRHLPLGAVLQPRLPASRPRRALLSWFLIDETTGLALGSPRPVERTMTVAGVAAYLAWVVGTVAGVTGASADGIAPLADALFPVLFIGLAAVTARDAGDRARAMIAAAAASALLLVVPAAGVLGALGVAVVTASVGVRR